MLLEMLPLELVQYIIGLVLSEERKIGSSKALIAMMRVNKALERQAASVCLRDVQDTRHGLGWWPQVPFQVRLRIAREIIATEPAPGEKRTIATYMHAVAYYIQQFAKFHDPKKAGRMGRLHWLHEIACVLALNGADCGCGKPAFMHSKCYDLSSVPDTAFHFLFLRQHTKLEAMMILEEGKDIASMCPYLKVSKKDPLYTRRNALEWACARGLEKSVVRLIAVTEERGRNPESYLPMAAAVCAMHTKSSTETLLGFLLTELDRSVRDPYWYARFQYCGKILSIRDWTLKVLMSLAQHNRLDGVSVLRKRYPYLEGENVISVLPKQFRWESIKIFMETERPHCIFQKWDEDGNRRHWTGCRKNWCRNRFNKAGPWDDVCKGHFWMQMAWGNDWRCEKQHPPHDPAYDWRGWPAQR